MSVVLPEDSGPNTSTMRPFGTPPIPSARSSDSAPVGIASTRTCAPSSPMRMTEPLPNSRSIWPSAPCRAASRAFAAFSSSVTGIVLLLLSKIGDQMYVVLRTELWERMFVRSSTSPSIPDARLAVGSSANSAGEESLLAHEGLARGLDDLHLRQLAGRSEAGEVDDLVVACASALALGVCTRGPFDKPLHGTAHEALRALGGATLDHLNKPFHALYLDRMGHDPLGHLGCLGASTGREDEGERAVIAHLLGDLQRLLEILLTLSREADDDVGRDRGVGHVLADQGHTVEIALAVVGTAHRLEDATRARLQRQVDVLAHARKLHMRADHVLAHILRMGTRIADALDSLDRVDLPQQIGKRLRFTLHAQIPSVGVDVLAEQGHLAHTVVFHRLHLCHQLLRWPRYLPPTRARHDAVGAAAVADDADLPPALK